MKKILFSLTALFFTTPLFFAEPVQAQTPRSTNEIPITTEYFAKAKNSYAKDMFLVATRADSDMNGFLSEEERNAVTKISFMILPDKDDIDTESPDFNGYPVFTKEDFKFDFKGIQFFSQLKEITIYQAFGDTLADNYNKNNKGGYNSQIVNFDLLYQLENLETLRLSEANIKEIDFSKMKSLKKVDFHNLYNLTQIKISKSSRISTLRLNACPKLKQIQISTKNTTLKTLDLMDLKKYTSFDFNSKSLKNLYVQNLPKVSTLALKKLPKLKNVTINNLPRLKSLDVSTLKNLSILNIENCTPITSVKFSKKQRPTDIYFESLPNLKKFNAPLHKCIMLRLYNTSISNINFKSAKKLLYLNLVNNKIKNVDLSKSKKINSITLSSQYIKRLTLAKRNILDSLEWSSSGLKTFKVNNLNKKSLTYLNLRGNKIKTLNVKKFPNLTSIGVDKKVKVIK